MENFDAVVKRIGIISTHLSCHIISSYDYKMSVHVIY